MGERSRISSLAGALGHQIKRSTVYVASREAMVNAPTHYIVTGAAALGSALGVLAMGAAGSIAALMVQLDHRHDLKNLLRMYDDELSSKLGKPKKDLKIEDLEILAKGDPALGIEPNKTLAEQLHKERKHRNFDMAFSIVASLAAFALVVGVLAPMLHAAAVPMLVGFAAKGAVGFLAFNAVKWPLDKVVGKAVGLHTETTHERIAAIQHCRQRGVAINHEDVASVYVAANKDLQNFIENRFGQSFDKLNHAEHLRATNLLAQYLPIEQVTHDLNTRRISPAELAFTVQGDYSGVVPKEPKVRRGLMSLFHRHAPVAAFVPPATAAQPAYATAAVEEPANSRWRDQFSSRGASTHMSHVQRLDEQAAEAGLSRV